MMEQSNKRDIMESGTDDHANALTYRLTGAVVWLGLMMIVVPVWYNQPANFSPDDAFSSNMSSSLNDTASKTFTGVNSAKVNVSTAAEPKTPSSNGSKSKEQGALDPEPQTHAPLEKRAGRALIQKESSGASQEVSQAQWIIRVAAFHKKDDAEALEQRLKYDYETFIKFFPGSRYYSVRIGPYDSKDRAIKDQQRLNRILRIRSELVKTQ